MMEHLLNYKWELPNFPAPGIEKNNYKVFSCFAGGGGSSMGYKLAGFETLGGNEIDPKMGECYQKNLNPQYFYIEDIRNFKNRNDFPDELYNLDILDGSPPCSSFSIAGNREKDWGKEKKFREGQGKQILDDLFFDFIDLAEKLQPRIVLAENVKGLIMGEAKKYVTEIGKAFDRAGYYVEKWLLDASRMGIPQQRERVFFLAIRKDLTSQFIHKIDLFNPLPFINLEFNEDPILFKDVWTGKKGRHFTEKSLEYWNNTLPGYSFSEAANGSWFNHCRLSNNKVIPTLTTETAAKYHLPDHPECIDDETIILASSFPSNYNFTENKISYVTGMSVPPIMITQIALRIKQYWLDKLI